MQSLTVVDEVSLDVDIRVLVSIFSRIAIDKETEFALSQFRTHTEECWSGKWQLTKGTTRIRFTNRHSQNRKKKKTGLNT